MQWIHEASWQPTELLTIAESVATSTGATEVDTDAGRAYIKPMGNRSGPHVLATDWVGTHLAKWFGLSTFDIALLPLTADDSFPLPDYKGSPYKAEPGPAFAARYEHGASWGRTTRELDELVNPEDITRLVVFDTWTLNCDRHHYDTAVRRPNYDNVYLSTEGVEPGKRRLIAMDQGLCFIRSGEDLTPNLSRIDKVQDDHVYGIYPEFRDRLDVAMMRRCADRLGDMEPAISDAMIATVPQEWEVSDETRRAWSELVCRRAAYVADNVETWVNDQYPWFGVQGD